MKTILDYLKRHKFVIGCVLLFATVTLLHYYASTLNEQIAQKDGQIAQLKENIRTRTQELTAQQLDNDRYIKEVGKNVYKQAMAVPDSDIVDAFNLCIAGARKRNTERKRNNN